MRAPLDYEIVDAQLHLSRVEAPGPAYSPDRPLDQRRNFDLESALAAMEAVGVGAALVDDMNEGNSYALEAARRYPGMFGPIAVLDPEDRSVTDVTRQAREDGALGVRAFVRTRREVERYRAGGMERLLDAADAQGLTLFVLGFRHLAEIADMASRHESLSIVIDHVGMPQPPWRVDSPPFARIDELLGLSALPNIAIKLCGMPSYSRESYPYSDVWPGLHRIVTSFGPERLMWASDAGRFFGMFTYSQLLGYLLYTDELDESDKAHILGGTVRRLLNWPRGTVEPKRGWNVTGHPSPEWYEN